MRFKSNNVIYQGFYGNYYFWRTTQQQEIDFIEEIDGKFSAYEFKLNTKKKFRISKTFINNYKVDNIKIITPENFDEFVG